MLRHVRTLFHTNFMATEAAAGVVMMLCAALALIIANSALADDYIHLIHHPLIGTFTVSHVIHDGLMAFFFLLVGMELKYEMLQGSLAAKGQKILPLMAALGGIIMPAIVYTIITAGQPELLRGWAIPTATDIAFAVCVLKLAGPRTPPAARSFLLALAIYDDLAAILIIAFFYSGTLHLVALAAAFILTLAAFLLNRWHGQRVAIYAALGALLWIALYHAGIHPTLAGVITALAIPLRRPNGAPLLKPLLQRLHPYVAFVVLPLFAFTSAGIRFNDFTLSSAFASLPVAIAVALCLGKPLGIVAATWISVKSGLAPLPTAVNWRIITGIGVIAGIGFTMSLFLGNLAFDDALLRNQVKLGVLAGSLLASAGGIYLFLRAKPAEQSNS
jgi:NhaA family Na+:H+ antiporter